MTNEYENRVEIYVALSLETMELKDQNERRMTRLPASACLNGWASWSLLSLRGPGLFILNPKPEQVGQRVVWYGLEWLMQGPRACSTRGCPTDGCDCE